MPTYSGQHIVKVAKKHGLEVTPGKGSHMKIHGGAGRGYMIVPMHKELSKGVACCVVKWFAKLGILLALIIGICKVMG